MDPINLSVLFTRLPRTQGTKETKLRVATEVATDVDDHIVRGFFHPSTGAVDLQGLVHVAWGLVKLGWGKGHECNQLLQLVDRHLDSSGSEDQAMALN